MGWRDEEWEAAEERWQASVAGRCVLISVCNKEWDTWPRRGHGSLGVCFNKECVWDLKPLNMPMCAFYKHKCLWVSAEMNKWKVCVCVHLCLCTCKSVCVCARCRLHPLCAVHENTSHTHTHTHITGACSWKNQYAGDRNMRECFLGERLIWAPLRVCPNPSNG